MRMSPYFSQLKDSYQSEIDDLRFDSVGNDVLEQRLAEKRRAFKELLPMMECAPEMVAATFHGSISVNDRALMETYVLQHPDALPTWDIVSGSLSVRADHDALIALALSAEGGDAFLVTMACLQFLFDVQDDQFVSQADDSDELDHADEQDVEDDEDEKVEDWLSKHGFDRRSTT